MSKFLIIPVLNEIESSLALAKEYGFGFEFNDFFFPDVLEDGERLENTFRTDLTFSFELTRVDSRGELHPYSRDLTITLTPNARRTLAWLEEFSGLGESYELRPHVAGEEDEDYWEAVLKEQAVNYATEIG